MIFHPGKWSQSFLQLFRFPVLFETSISKLSHPHPDQKEIGVHALNSLHSELKQISQTLTESRQKCDHLLNLIQAEEGAAAANNHTLKSSKRSDLKQLADLHKKHHDHYDKLQPFIKIAEHHVKNLKQESEALTTALTDIQNHLDSIDSLLAKEFPRLESTRSPR